MMVRDLRKWTKIATRTKAIKTMAEIEMLIVICAAVFDVDWLTGAAGTVVT